MCSNVNRGLPFTLQWELFTSYMFYKHSLAKIQSNVPTIWPYVIRLHFNEYYIVYSITIKDVGLYTDCNGMKSHELKPVDFDFPEGQIQRLHGENRFPDQYFVACVPHVTDDDILLYREAKAKYGNLVNLVRTFSLSFYIWYT